MTTIRIEQDQLIIRVDQWDYEIELERLNTPQKILGWVYHLCGKNWVTPSVIEEFIDFATTATGQEQFEVTA